MELSAFYPSPTDLIDNEVRVLDYLRKDRYIKEQHPEFAQIAAQTYGKTRNGKIGLHFLSYFDVWHKELQNSTPPPSRQGKRKANLRLFIAALVEMTAEQAYSNVSYCLSICRLRRDEHVVIYRKFHFDVTITTDDSNRRRQQHPRCHLQYCGKLVPGMERMGCRDSQLLELHPRLSEPRILFWPMSLALLVDLALHEFPDPKSTVFREASEWRSIVRRHEELLLLPFHQRCAEVIRDVSGKSRTLADEFYTD